MTGIIIAIVSGVLMSVQGVMNTGVTKQTSVWISAAFVQATALLVCLMAWFFTGRDGNFGSLLQVEPKYMLLGGVFGALITYTVIRSISSLGAAQAILIIVVAQLFAAYLIELFGLLGAEKAAFQWTKLIGVLIAVGGIILFQWEKK